MPSRKRLLFGGTMAAALVVVLGSTAFACTLFRGRMYVSGNGTGNTGKYIVGDPTDPFDAFEWCGSPQPPAMSASETDRASFWTTRVNDSSPVLGVGVVATTTDCVPTGETSNKLPQGSYTVAIANGFWGTDDSDGEDNCHSNNGNTNNNQSSVGTVIDSAGYSVDGNGYGSKTYSGTALNNATNVGWNNVCVYLVHDPPVAFDPANVANFKSV